MAYPACTPHWAEIKRLAELGVPLPKLADDFGIKVATIYARVAKEDWLIPSRLKSKLDNISNIHRKMSGDPLLTEEGLAEKSESILLETWETRAADLRNLSYSVAVQAIKEAKGQIVIESASDLKHAVHVARQATGLLDTDAPQIQLSLFGAGDICGPSVMENQAIDVEALQPVEESDDFWG